MFRMMPTVWLIHPTNVLFLIIVNGRWRDLFTIPNSGQKYLRVGCIIYAIYFNWNTIKYISLLCFDLLSFLFCFLLKSLCYLRLVHIFCYFSICLFKWNKMRMYTVLFSVPYLCFFLHIFQFLINRLIHKK